MMLWGLLGCGPEPNPPQEPPAGCLGSGTGRVGECAGDFTLPTTGGGTFTLTDHHGEIVVVHVASTGSDLDADAAQLVSTLSLERRVVAVDVLATDPVSPPLTGDDALAWRDALQLVQPVAWDATETFGESFVATGQTPTILVLDADGIVLARIHDQYPAQLPAALELAMASD